MFTIIIHRSMGNLNGYRYPEIYRVGATDLADALQLSQWVALSVCRWLRETCWSAAAGPSA